ncbi:MAG: KH domain-containing protein [Pyrinomonadaceae bacterium]
MQATIEMIIKAIVDHKDEVSVKEVKRDRATLFEVRVAGNDMGKLIGRQGRTIRALRSLLSVAGVKHGRKFVIELVEDSD